MSTENTAPTNKKRRAVLMGITALFVVAGIAYGAYYMLVLSKRVETDNAYVGGNLVNVTAQVSGSVIEIRADETQLVQAGTEIIKLDPSDAQVALAQAEARHVDDYWLMMILTCAVIPALILIRPPRRSAGPVAVDHAALE